MASVLSIAAGYATLTGRRERNEDFCAIVTPTGAELSSKGVVAAVADGVSGSGGGREAAEFSVRGLLADYYATPDPWEVGHALERVLSAVNRWVNAQSAARREYAGMASTLSAVVLRGCRYFLAHIGDSRIYLLRAGHLRQLTTDHVWDQPEMQHVLTRAIGLHPHLLLDYADGELQQNDVLLLVTDGVWETLGDAGMQRIIELHREPQRAATVLADTALERGSNDNCSAVVLRVDNLPPVALSDSLAGVRVLPLPRRLKPGQAIDGFSIVELVHESRATLIYKVTDTITGQHFILKTLQPALADDEHSRSALLAEEWLARRVVSHYFPQVLPLSSERRSHLYYVMSWHEGANLQRRLDTGHHFSPAETAQIGIRLMKALGALHRLDIVHRDVKPANLHLDADGRMRMLDLGVAICGMQRDGQPPPGNPGTPSYMAPELFSGKPADACSDLYAAGVTLYHLLTRHYPYGEVEPFQRPRFTAPIPPTRYRPDIPIWLEGVLLKAVAREPRDRFETAEEFLLALERGEMRPLLMRRAPLAERDPLLLCRAICAVSIVLNLLLLYLLVVIL